MITNNHKLNKGVLKIHGCNIQNNSGYVQMLEVINNNLVSLKDNDMRIRDIKMIVNFVDTRGIDEIDAFLPGGFSIKIDNTDYLRMMAFDSISNKNDKAFLEHIECNLGSMTSIELSEFGYRLMDLFWETSYDKAIVFKDVHYFRCDDFEDLNRIFRLCNVGYKIKCVGENDYILEKVHTLNFDIRYGE